MKKKTKKKKRNKQSTSITKKRRLAKGRETNLSTKFISKLKIYNSHNETSYSSTDTELANKIVKLEELINKNNYNTEKNRKFLNEFLANTLRALQRDEPIFGQVNRNYRRIHNSFLNIVEKIFDYRYDETQGEYEYIRDENLRRMINFNRYILGLSD
jgi:hypothetical protein